MKSCAKCNGELRHGDTVVQFGYGRYVGGYITPTGRDFRLLGEYHEACKPLERSQFLPYHCEICGNEILNGQEMVFAVKGTMLIPPYIRSGSRGYSLYNVTHRDCYDSLSA